MRKPWIGFLFVGILVLAGSYASAASLLVYHSGGSQYVLEQALTQLGYTYDVRSAANPVTALDLASHNALIIGWSAGGFDMSGLNSAVLTAGITGNKLITGHDADYHTVAGVAAAATLLDRYVQFAAGSPGNTGILAFPVFAAEPFSYLPSAWGIASFDSLTSETIDSITAAGLASGLYAGLTTATLSNWGQSFHANFTAWGAGFSSFEIGHPPEGANVTIGTTVTPITPIPEPASLILFGTGLGVLGLAAWRRKK